MAFWLGRTCALSLAGALTIAAQAAAEPASSPETVCDGYGPFSRTRDGLIAGRALFGGPRIDQVDQAVRRDSWLGAAGVRACDEALAKLPEAHKLRRVSLLRSRALHHLANDELDAALRDIDLAAASTADTDVYARRSLGLGNDWIRAVILRQQGKRREATALALQAWRERPYNRQTATSALAAMGDGADPAQAEVVMRGFALLNPEVTGRLFFLLVEQRRFADAISLYGQLSPPHDYGDEPMTPAKALTVDFENRVEAEKFWALNNGAYAYALMATGRRDEALAQLKTARTRLESAFDDMASGKAWSPKDAETLEYFRQSRLAAPRKVATEALDAWEELVGWRRLAGEDLEGLFRQFGRARIPNTPVSLDVLDTAIANLTPEYADAKAPLTELKQKIADAPRDELRRELEVLYSSLPDAETPRRVTKYGRKAGDGFEKVDAYKVTPNGAGVTVVYYGSSQSRAMVEELALLYAAEDALRAGKPGLIVTDRRDYDHSIVPYFGPSPDGKYTGFDTRLDVLYVDPRALPAGYESAGWRVIDAARVYQELGPIYGAPVQVSGR